MKTKALCFLFLLIALSTQVFAKGKADKGDNEKKTQNDEWILCITDFDVSSLYAEKTNISGMVIKNMIERFNAINYRTRISPEYAYYEEHAWTHEKTTAAKALSAKLDERSSKIYLGEPEWRYKQTIASLDTQIEDLRLKLEEVENSAPIINKEPVFKVKNASTDTSFPSAPKSGAEVRFCREQNADAFLSGSIRDFYGRYLLSVKLFTAYTRSYVWEDSLIFSHDDLSSVLEELILRMIIVLSGNKPSAITFVTEPQDALVLINRSFAGKGDAAIMEYPAGKVTITASALNHDSYSFETELNPGELTVVNLRLNPIEYGNLDIMGNHNGNVYHGALYVGEAPVTLRLPSSRMEYIQVENSNRKGLVVFQTPSNPEFDNSLSVRMDIMPKKGHLDRARRHYYWVWGGTWIAGIAAWISYYTFTNISMAITSDYNATGSYNDNFYKDYYGTYEIFTGTLIALGVVSAYGIYRMIRYIGTSGKGTVPVTVTGRKK